MREIGEEWLIVLIILLVSLISFGLGRISVFYGDTGSIEVLYPKDAQGGAVYQSMSKEEAEQALREKGLPAPGGQYVASKTGSKYHFPWCPGAQQMKEENKVWFESKESAEAAGYTPAANCKGL